MDFSKLNLNNIDGERNKSDSGSEGTVDRDAVVSDESLKSGSSDTGNGGSDSGFVSHGTVESGFHFGKLRLPGDEDGAVFSSGSQDSVDEAHTDSGNVSKVHDDLVKVRNVFAKSSGGVGGLYSSGSAGGVSGSGVSRVVDDDSVESVSDDSGDSSFDDSDFVSESSDELFEADDFVPDDDALDESFEGVTSVRGFSSDDEDLDGGVSSGGDDSVNKFFDDWESDSDSRDDGLAHDEGDEFVLNVAGLAAGRDGSGVVDDDGEPETFTGFKNEDVGGGVRVDGSGGVKDSSNSSSVSVGLSGNGVSSGGSGDGFDEVFESLLDDDDDESVGSGGVDSSVEGGSVVSGGETVLDHVDNFLNDSDTDAMLFDGNKSRQVEGRPFVSGGLKKDVSEGGVKRRIPRKKSVLESDFVRHDVSEESLKPGSSVRKGKRQRYRYVTSDGRLNGAELQFFKNIHGSKAAFDRDKSLAEKLRGPVGRNESEAERKKRTVLFEQGVRGADALKRGSKLRFSERDREVVQFLAMFRYATDQQLARMFSLRRESMYNRLKKLRSQGLVIDKKLYGARPIWFLTDAGMLLSGMDLPRVRESKLSFSMFPHQFTVNNTAANLWSANINVLGLDDFPSCNRVNDKGEHVHGEMLVSELEIQSSFGKIKMFDRAEVFRPQLKATIEREFDDWKRAGGVSFGESPEMVYGNEYMWALMPPYTLNLAYHVPDLVVKRPRNEDGSPRSIAVEIEINNKPLNSYEKTLRAYKADTLLYEKVIWVCKNVGPARKLESIAKDIGLWQERRIDIVPVLTEDGVFKEKDLWTI